MTIETLLKIVKVESEKVGLKLSIQKMKIMAFGPITSWCGHYNSFALRKGKAKKK